MMESTKTTAKMLLNIIKYCMFNGDTKILSKQICADYLTIIPYKIVLCDQLRYLIKIHNNASLYVTLASFIKPGDCNLLYLWTNGVMTGNEYSGNNYSLNRAYMWYDSINDNIIQWCPICKNSEHIDKHKVEILHDAGKDCKCNKGHQLKYVTLHCSTCYYKYTKIYTKYVNDIQFKALCESVPLVHKEQYTFYDIWEKHIINIANNDSTFQTVIMKKVFIRMHEDIVKHSKRINN